MIGHKDKDGKEICLGHVLKTNILMSDIKHLCYQIQDEACWMGIVISSNNQYILSDGMGNFSLKPEWDKCEIIEE